MKRYIAFVLAAVFLSGSAYGFNFNLYDFGDSPFDENNNYSPISYPYGIGNEPSPGTLGEGGEKFDLEGLKVAMDNDYVYIAMANSFGYSAYSTGWNRTYELGDLFIGTGSGLGYAIDLTNGGSNGLYQVTGRQGIPNYPGTYYGTSIAPLAGDFRMTSGNYLGSVTTMMTFWDDYETDYLQPGDGDTYVWEFRFARSLLGDFSQLDLHLTLACGNDVMNKTVAVVPEPGTILLLGAGLAGAALLRRRRSA